MFCFPFIVNIRKRIGIVCVWISKYPFSGVLSSAVGMQMYGGGRW